jgi:Xaa-Pro aminopeptidase
MGILNKSVHGTIEDVIEHRKYTPFYMHRTSHWLGMDVHDCGSYVQTPSSDNFTLATPWSELDPLKPWSSSAPTSRTLEAGMVLTIEPGLYIRPSPDVPEKYWNIGVRIEDDALITPHGVQLLSRGVPVNVSDIEQLMS